MKAEFLNPFVYAGLKVLGSETGIQKWTPDKPFLVRADSTRHAVNVVVAVMGSVGGLVVYGLDLAMAKEILKRMAGIAIPINDSMADSALGELGNLITAQASVILEGSGYPCRISPPSIVRGTAVRITENSTPFVALPIYTELGEMRIYLALQEVGDRHSSTAPIFVQG